MKVNKNVLGEYVVILSEEEATVVYDVVGWVGGDGPERDITEELFDALESAGVKADSRSFKNYDPTWALGIKVKSEEERR